MIIDAEAVEALVVGGAFLGGGGGGSLAEGRRLGLAALELGRPKLIPVAEVRADDLLATVSVVGAPAARDKHVEPEDFIRALKLLTERLGRSVAGIISSENGGTSSVNGLLQSAALGIPVVDCPCNGRAHPTGVMGSMGLGQVPGFTSRQAAVGGNRETGSYLEVYAEASLAHADILIRRAAAEAGGLVAVARNPMEARYVRDHGAAGAIRMALELGRVIMNKRNAGGEAVARELATVLKGDVVGSGRVAALELETSGGYDVGRLFVGDLEVTFWNEYMTLERGGLRLATFPDLIATLDTCDGTPLTSADLQAGAEVTVVRVPRNSLILGAGMRVAENFLAVEDALKRPILRYVFED